MSESNSDSSKEVKKSTSDSSSSSSDSDSGSSSDDSDSEDSKNLNSMSEKFSDKDAEDIKEEKKVVDTINGPVVETTTTGYTQSDDGKRKYFSRIDRSKVQFENEALKDNTYQGAAGNWGEQANTRLRQVRGKDFTKNKNKMKKGSYRGGSIISNASGSYKFQD